MFTKARLGILDLEVQRGKWKNIPRHERICKVCDGGEVEDVFHFILKCQLYKQERKYFIPNFVPNRGLCFILSI